MAAPSLTYTLTNGTTADASQVMQNYNDLLNGITDGTKDLTINALTMNGALNCKGNVTLGDATGDDVTVTGSLASTINIKTTNTYNIGSATLGLAGIYLGTSSTQTARIVSTGTLASSRTYTLLDAGAAANFVLSEGTATINGAKTFGTSIALATAGGTASALNYYEEFSGTITMTGGLTSSPTTTAKIMRIGRFVIMSFTGLSATSNATTNPQFTFSDSGSNIPTRFAPSGTTQYLTGLSIVVDSGATSAGTAAITTSAVEFCKNYTGASASFTASGTKGSQSAVLMWQVV